MGVDGVAVLLIVLTTLLGVIARSLMKYPKAREGILRLLLLLQTLWSASSLDGSLLFYLFFEVSLVPIYFLIASGRRAKLYGGDHFFL